MLDTGASFGVFSVVSVLFRPTETLISIAINFSRNGSEVGERMAAMAPGSDLLWLASWG